jgi:hypothetical protein
MPDLHFIRAEIERMLVQVRRQQRDICTLRECGLATQNAEALLERMRATLQTLRADRDRLIREAKLNGPTYASGKRIHGTPANRRA